MRQKVISLIPLFLILALAAFFRLYNINWDNGYHLHPDERAITLFAIDLRWPSSLKELLSSNSPLNPHFFAYGSFPLYLLQGGAHLFQFIDTSFPTYDKINLLGRLFSAFFDIGSIIILYALCRRVFNKQVGYIASFLYAVAVLPIQLSHFYAVDTLLTFFMLLTLLQLLRFYDKPSIKIAFLIGLFLGFALATKISAIVLLAPIGLTLSINFLTIVFKKPFHIKQWSPHFFPFFKSLLLYGTLIASVSALTFIILEPYALIDHIEFFQQNLQQATMTKDAFTFPYTLQYVGKVPYIYEIKNILFWGFGLMEGLICLMGMIYFTGHTLLMRKKESWAKEFILITFFVVYFIIVGRFAIGFMRYMLPVYPIFCFGGGLFLYSLFRQIKQKSIRFGVFTMVGISLIIWPVCFMMIYTKPNTRVLASEWITSTIPTGDTIAIEHWDDGLPLFGQQRYTIETLELYNPDTNEKWKKINDQLERSDYYIIASNRLYTPLLKLTDCSKLPPDRCYPQTAMFYRNLFSGRSHFKKVAEFTNYPRVPFTSLVINDQSADESFTVYDHPKVMIFKREE